MENINLILFGAIGIGVVLILISIVINTILNLKKRITQKRCSATTDYLV